jgi:hypothetical protein
MQKIKAYCHTSDTLELDAQPLECCEVSIIASPFVLREIAAFLLRSADKFEERLSDVPDHFHLRDEWVNWDESESVDLIVVAE